VTPALLSCAAVTSLPLVFPGEPPGCSGRACALLKWRARCGYRDRARRSGAAPGSRKVCAVKPAGRRCPRQGSLYSVTGSGGTVDFRRHATPVPRSRSPRYRVAPSRRALSTAKTRPLGGPNTPREVVRGVTRPLRRSEASSTTDDNSEDSGGNPELRPQSRGSASS